MDRDEKLIHDIYFCYGPGVSQLYVENGHTINEAFYSGGTLRVSKFLESKTLQNIVNVDENTNNQYDICVISQWIYRNFHGDEKILGEAATSIRDATIGMLEMLNELMCGSNISVIICLRSNNKEEKNFFEQYLGNNISFLEPASSEFHSYEGIMQSNVILGVSSTLLIEAVALNKQSLWCNLDKHPFHDVIPSNYTRFFVNERDQFQNKIKSLLFGSNEQARCEREALKFFLSPLMNDNLPTKKLNELIMSLLK